MYEQTSFQSAAEAPKKSNSGLLIGIGVAVVLCCCCLIGSTILVLTVLGPAVNNVFSTVNEGLLTPAAPEFPAVPEIPVFPTDESGLPQIPESPYGYGDLIPQGGLGDDLLRADTWGYVIAAAAMSGCAATDASKTSIEVIQQPDAGGTWMEKWTVTCDDGTKKSFDVTFTPSAQGGTTISVTGSK